MPSTVEQKLHTFLLLLVLVTLQDLLGYSRPTYLHIPVATHPDGQKLSKLTGAAAIPLDNPKHTLVQALEVLGQQPPNDLRDAALAEIWAWACRHWQIDTLAGMPRVDVDRNAIANGKNGLL